MIVYVDIIGFYNDVTRTHFENELRGDETVENLKYHVSAKMGHGDVSSVAEPENMIVRLDGVTLDNSDVIEDGKTYEVRFRDDMPRPDNQTDGHAQPQDRTDVPARPREMIVWVFFDGVAPFGNQQASLQFNLRLGDDAAALKAKITADQRSPWLGRDSGEINLWDGSGWLGDDALILDDRSYRAQRTGS